MYVAHSASPLIPTITNVLPCRSFRVYVCMHVCVCVCVCVCARQDCECDPSDESKTNCEKCSVEFHLDVTCPEHQAEVCVGDTCFTNNFFFRHFLVYL